MTEASFQNMVSKTVPACGARRFVIAALVLAAAYLGLYWWVDQQFNGRLSPNRITRSDLRSIEITLLRFRSLNARFPTEDEGLAALVTPPAGAVTRRLLTAQGIVDAWGSPYKYRVPGTREKLEYDLYSMGPDGKEDTDDDIYLDID